MKPEECISITTIMAIGCDHYKHLPGLHNVRQELTQVHEIFCGLPYSIYPEANFTELYDCSSLELRKAIQEFVTSRSAEQDILLIFFAGHGTAIGRDDFGFCMNDAALDAVDSVILPTSVVKLSEIIGSLNIKNVSLLLFVDACYSGQISRQLHVTFPEITSEMNKSLVAYSGSFFGLVSSCTSLEQVEDLGVLCKGLQDICEQGVEENTKFLPFGSLPENLTERIDHHAKGSSRSRIFIPPGRISTLPVCLNVQYYEEPEPVNIYSFTKPYLLLLVTMWNDGNPIQLTPAEILERTGSQSAYANHKKLSLPNWELLKSSNGRRMLTKKGIRFLLGTVSIPKTIIENKVTRAVAPAPNAPLLAVAHQKDFFGCDELILQEHLP